MIFSYLIPSGWYAQDGVLAAAELFEEFCGILIGGEAVVDADGPDPVWVGAEGFVYVPRLFGVSVQVLDEVWEGFCSGSYAESLFELVQLGDVGYQAGWGMDWWGGFEKNTLTEKSIYFYIILIYIQKQQIFSIDLRGLI